ncbi:GP48.2 [Caviid betaherpesvirus 2]|uniref:Small capsomere-interacting protein n=1 Tax=Guinea pig cytomegalovirus (strain 22122) TaxID=103920 RepID=E9RH64_GPCMV|nr:GP48.2 [Caviid betaherpesvirus 2]AGE11527.1 GP48.2 [Caviid betaherpesvirus 2]AIL83915.1 GP48.2 [BAC cloning vector GPN13BACdenovo_preserved(MM)]BAJ78516.1 GP48.1 [Caviid betaherpesvirus 2]
MSTQASKKEREKEEEKRHAAVAKMLDVTEYLNHPTIAAVIPRYARNMRPEDLEGYKLDLLRMLSVTRNRPVIQQSQ